MDGVRAADRVRRGLGEPDVAHLARSDELSHRAHGLLDRRLEVDAVLIVEVDVVDAEPLERRLARLVDVLAVALDPAPRGIVGVADDPELRRQLHLVAAAGDRAADEHLVRERAVHVGGVEEGDAELERAVDRRDRLVLVARPVEIGHPHAAEADPRDLEALCAERDSPHPESSGYIIRRAACRAWRSAPASPRASP
jgi:hypothetical protein